MANKLISQLTAASSVTGTDLIEIEQSGASKKATLALVLAYVEANLDSVAGNLDVGGVLDVTGLASFGSSGIKITNSFGGTILADNLSGDRSFQLPDAAGTFCLDTGSINIATVGTITTGTWSASTITANKGGTGQTSYTDGQLLIGNSTGNTLTKATLTAGTGISISNGSGSISIGLTNSSITIAGTSVSLGGSITTSAILDSLGSTRGSILYRGASGWSILTPGTSGHSLVSNGAGADPTWQSVSGGVSDGDKGDIVVSGTGATWTLDDLLTPGLGATPSSSRLALRNLTAATSGNQQASGALELEGQGFATTGSASQSVKWRVWAQPVQGSANPSGNFLVQSSINGGAWTTRGTLTSAGQLIVTSLQLDQLSDITWNGASGGGVSGSGYYKIDHFKWLNCTSGGLQFGVLGSGSADAYLQRRTANWLGMGKPGATPSVQTWGGQDGSGTNISGGRLRTMGGRGTGTGNAGGVEVATSLPGTSGTTVHGSAATRALWEGKATALTHATATAFAQISLQTSKVVGGKLIASVCATDGTDWQCLTSDVIFSAVNKAGTITYKIDQIHGEPATSSGTLSVNYTIDQNSNAVDIKVNAVSDLTGPTYEIKWSIVALNSNDATTVTPQ